MNTRRKNIIYTLTLVSLFVVFFTSCYKTDPDDISGEFVWLPDISLPIGEVETNMTKEEADKYPVNTVPNKRSYLYDTLNFKLSDIVELRENIDSLMIRLNIVNKFPFDGAISVFYLQKGQQGWGYEISLTGEPVRIARGKINENTGESTIPSKKQVDVWLRPTQIDTLFLADYFIVRADVLLNDTITQPIKDNLTQYKFSTEIALQAKLNFAYE